MRQPRTLPSAPPRAILQIFADVLKAGDDTLFTANTLRQRGISSRQALTVLRYLDCLCQSGRLQNDVRELRADPSRLSELLKTRLESRLVEEGCDPATIQELGSSSSRLSGSQLDDLLRSLPPIKVKTNPCVISNLVGSLKTLYYLFQNRLDRDWLERELRALEARHSQRKRSRSAHGNGHTVSAHDGMNPSQDRSRQEVSARMMLERLVDVSVCSECTLVSEAVTVDFDEEMPVVVQLTLPANLSSIQLKRLANHLMRKAEFLAGQEEC
jgi:hypothetical protein